MSVVPRIWFGDDAVARATRVALLPLAGLYRLGVSVRNSAYDRGLFHRAEPSLPAVSVGNLSVGGTGKTPAAAWFAAELRRRGARPAIVMRGVGDDEPEVHRTLNPDVPVIANPDRLRGIDSAREQGCDVAVLDDAFQHRRLRRSEDVVLVSADQWTSAVRVLPRGPWREPLSSLRRSTLLIVTRKAVSAEASSGLLGELARWTAAGAGATAAIVPDGAHDVVTGARHALSELAGKRVLAVSGVADPSSFSAQLRQAGADAAPMAYPDHHRYTAIDVDRVVARARSRDVCVCTLKDAVKLRSLWPRRGPALWYVSQRFEVEEGLDRVGALLQRVLLARESLNR